ncbi:MAG: Bromodomain and PHD finger-containing protein 1, partial [Marteilia pararefringens]
MKKEAFCSIHSNNIDPHNIFNNDYRLYKKRISDKIQQSEIFLSGNEIDGAKAKQIVNYWMMSKLVHNGYQKYPRVNKRSHNLQRKKRSAVAKDILSICKLIFEREKIKYQAFKTVLEITNEYWKKLDKIIKTIYEFIKFLDTESVFEYPVDLQLYPNYTQFVKHPIDLSIICSKIKSSDYKKFSAFKNDINTMYKNCLIYNPEGNYYNEYARKMQEITNVVFIRHEKQLTDFMVEIIQSLKRNFATNNLYSSERKRSKLLPISKIMEKENIKPEDIKIHKLYWVKAVGINWFPGIVIDLNTTEADYDGLFAKPQGRILDLNPNDENYNLIMYAHEKKKLQWVHKRSMYEMFSNKKIDDIFL